LHKIRKSPRDIALKNHAFERCSVEQAAQIPDTALPLIANATIAATAKPPLAECGDGTRSIDLTQTDIQTPQRGLRSTSAAGRPSPSPSSPMINSMGTMRRMMTATDVLLVWQRLREAGIGVWLDGGWGVDALLAEQNRPHDDLDLVIALADSPAAIAALAAVGFALAEDERPTRFVMRDGHDRRVDFHTVVFDEKGGGTQHLHDGSSWRYPPQGFAGHGQIDGQPVTGLTPAVQLLCHLDYDPDDTDRQDMRLLADRFGLSLPEPYARCDDPSD
jgi:lincosamide nucleotidyltransferase A/C/D/E